MDFDEMTPEEIRAVITEAEAVLAAREEITATRDAVMEAVAAYAEATGLSELDAWVDLCHHPIPEPEPEPEPEPIDAPEWVPPQAHEPYMKGDLVRYRGTVYESTVDNNVWSPLAYPQGWKEI